MGATGRGQEIFRVDSLSCSYSGTSGASPHLEILKLGDIGAVALFHGPKLLAEARGIDDALLDARRRDVTAIQPLQDKLGAHARGHPGGAGPRILCYKR